MNFVFMWTCGPCSIVGSKGLPTFLLFALSTLLRTNSSYMGSSTKMRDPAVQHWPALKNTPWWASSTATSTETRCSSYLNCLKNKYIKGSETSYIHQEYGGNFLKFWFFITMHKSDYEFPFSTWSHGSCDILIWCHISRLVLAYSLLYDATSRCLK